MRRFARGLASRIDLQWLALFVAADLVFIALHLVHVLALPDRTQWSIELDNAPAEVYEHVKNLWIVLLLGQVARREWRPLLLAWSGLFAYILLDDTLKLHERIGAALASASAGAHAGWGELAVFAGVGAVAVAIALVLVRRGARWSGTDTDLALLLLCLAFFGAGVDLVHTLLFPAFDLTLVLIEDGGEMVAMSLIGAYVVRLASRRTTPPVTGA